MEIESSSDSSGEYEDDGAFTLLCGCGRVVRSGDAYWCDCSECQQKVPIIGTRISYNRFCIAGLQDGTKPGDRINYTHDEIYGPDESGSSSSGPDGSGASSPSGSVE